MISFKNDYSEGAHPRILKTLTETNLEQAEGYGEDRFCLEAANLLRRRIDRNEAGIHFVSGGTQTNLIAISAFLKPHEAAIAAHSGHILVHETGAIEATGHKVISIESGKAVIEFEADERHANPMGTLHGGVLCDISDAAMGMAYASLLNEGESFTTLELKINFLKPICKAKLRAEGSVVSGGKTVGLLMCDVFDERGRLIARATSTCMTLRGEQTNGR